MNREQAIRAVADKIGLSGPFTTNLVDAMAAVGVLKLDEPASAPSTVVYVAASKWKVGDIVTLASGGPRMTVVQIFTGTHFQVTVEWYGADGAKCNDRFPQDALVAAQPAEPAASPLIIGEVIFKGETLAGEQTAILDRGLFEAVQAKLSQQVSNHKVSRTKSEALLLGRIFDDRSHRMTPSHGATDPQRAAVVCAV